MTGYYLVIMGSEKEESNQIMVNRLLELGEVRKLMKNFYIIKIADQNEDERVKVRDRLTGPEKYSVYVITLTEKLSTAWSMPKDNSEYLKKTIREELHGSVD